MSKIKYLLKPPWKELIRGRWLKMIETNAGVYTLENAAKEIGIETKTLRNRLNMYKWNVEGILTKDFKPKQSRVERTTVDLSHIPDGDLSGTSLGNKPRTENLDKIPSLTMWEQRLYND